MGRGGGLIGVGVRGLALWDSTFFWVNVYYILGVGRDRGLGIDMEKINCLGWD